MGSIPIRLTLQQTTIDQAGSLAALVGSILTDCASSISADVGAEEIRTQYTLDRIAREFGRLRVDCGLSFEYAVHDALRRSEGGVAERVSGALREYCGLTGTVPASILFGVGKNRGAGLVDTPKHLIAAGSTVKQLVGGAGKFAPMASWIERCADCFHSEGEFHLPTSIRAYWRPRLLLGYADQGVWVPSSFIQHSSVDLGLHVLLTPLNQDAGGQVRREDFQVVVCPIPVDGGFLSVFRRAWRCVRTLLAPDRNKHLAKPVIDPVDAELEGLLGSRRDRSLDELLVSLTSVGATSCFGLETRHVDYVNLGMQPIALGTILAPVARVRDRS